MYQDDGPYRKHFYSTPDDCDYIEIRSVPDGWKPILEPRLTTPKYTATVAAVAAVGAWALVAISAVKTFAG